MNPLKVGLAIALSTVGVGSGVAFGVANLAPANEVQQAQAANPTFNKDTKIYLDVSACDWFVDGAKVGLWNHQGNTFNEFTQFGNTNYYVATLSNNTSSFNVFRGSALNWDNKWNQSDDGSFAEGKNLMIAGAYSNNKLTFTWGTYDAGANKSKSSIYFRTPDSSHNIKVYTYETLNVDGVSFEVKLSGQWPGTEQQKTTKTVYNPANLSTSNTGIVKVEFEYYSLNNVGVIVNANNGQYQTRDLKVNPTSSQVALVVGAYYYSDNDINLWDNFHYDADMGYDAAVAYKIDKTDVCNINASDANALRSEMEANKGYLTNATWDSYNYSQAYSWINSKCSSPKALSNLILGISDDNKSIIAVSIIASTILASSGLFFIFKKRKHQ